MTDCTVVERSPLACQTDEDCPIGTVCRDGRCVDPQQPGCTSDADCSEGFVCVNGECALKDGGGGGGLSAAEKAVLGIAVVGGAAWALRGGS